MDPKYIPDLVFSHKPHRERRQIGNWNLKPLLNKFIQNATGIFDNIGQQMTRQFHNSVQDSAGKSMNGFNAVLNSMQENFKRFINLNLHQLKPEKLLTQMVSLIKT